MNWTLLKNSLLVSALTTLLAVALGFCAALFLAGLKWRWRRWWIGVGVGGLLAPLAGNALAQSAVLTFVLALNNFAVPALLQVKVFPVEVWVEFNNNLKIGAALAMSWPLVLAPMLLLFLLRRRAISWPRLEGAVLARVFSRQP